MGFGPIACAFWVRNENVHSYPHNAKGLLFAPKHNSVLVFHTLDEVHMNKNGKWNYMLSYNTYFLSFKDGQLR